MIRWITCLCTAMIIVVSWNSEILAQKADLDSSIQQKSSNAAKFFQSGEIYKARMEEAAFDFNDSLVSEYRRKATEAFNYAGIWYGLYYYMMKSMSIDSMLLCHVRKISLDPNNDSSWAAYAEDLEYAGLYDTARAVMLVAHDLDPSNAGYLLKLGEIFYELFEQSGNSAHLQNAASVCSTGLTLDSCYNNGWETYAVVLMTMGRNEEAGVAWNKSVDGPCSTQSVNSDDPGTTDH